MDWFRYDNGLRHKRVKGTSQVKPCKDENHQNLRRVLAGISNVLMKKQVV